MNTNTRYIRQYIPQRTSFLGVYLNSVDKSERIHLNKDKYNYWFIISFSLLSILFHLLPISREYHNTLYSANVLALAGFTIITVLFPVRFYAYYIETFRHFIYQIGLSRVIHLNIVMFYLVAWMIHAIPVWALRNTYTLANPIPWIVLYLLFAGPFLGKIYNLSFGEIGTVVVYATTLVVVWYYVNPYNSKPIQ